MKYTREKDLALFLNIAKKPRPRNADDIPHRVMIPAFMISELKTAFQIGFVLFLPFLVIDMVVATVLLVDGHDATAAGDGLNALQDSALYHGGWLELDRGFAGEELLLIESLSDCVIEPLTQSAQ